MKLSEQCIEAINNKAIDLAIESANGLDYNSNTKHFIKKGMLEVIGNPSIYSKAGLIRKEDAGSFAEWLPEAVEQSKDILKELRLLNIYKSLGVDNLKDAQSKIEHLVSEKAGLISLEQLNDLDDFIRWRSNNYYISQHFGGWVSKDGIGSVTRTSAELFLAYQEFYKS